MAMFVACHRKLPLIALLLSINVLNGDRSGPDWKRPRGRPRRMWLHQMEEDIEAPVSAAYDEAKIGQLGDRYDPPPVRRASRRRFGLRMDLIYTRS